MPAEQVGTLFCRCALCNGHPRWRLDRHGDAIVTWACEAHMLHILDDFLDRSHDRATIIDLTHPTPTGTAPEQGRADDDETRTR